MKDPTRYSHNEQQHPIGPKIAGWLVLIMIVYLVIAQ